MPNRIGGRSYYRQGDPVTVVPAATDPYILEFQRYAVVSESMLGDQYMIRLDATMPPYQTFGPIPGERLLPGWRDESGRFRRW